MVGDRLGEGQGVNAEWDRVSAWEDEKVLEMMLVTAAQQGKCL